MVEPWATAGHWDLLSSPGCCGHYGSDSGYCCSSGPPECRVRAFRGQAGLPLSLDFVRGDCLHNIAPPHPQCVTAERLPLSLLVQGPRKWLSVQTVLMGLLDAARRGNVSSPSRGIQIVNSDLPLTPLAVPSTPAALQRQTLTAVFLPA